MNDKIIFALLIGFVMTAIIIAGGHAPSGFFGKTAQPAKNESPAKIKTNVDHEDEFVPLAANEKASPTDQDVLISARKADSAPALADGKWINSEPLSLEKLRGQVVLLDFWTFGCFNCLNTLPAVKGFQSKYSDQGLTIVGIETPETPGEKVFDNLVKAVNKRGIRYPVLTDYEGDTWRAYDVDAWPTIIILDREGRIRYTHVGEGQYDMQEKVIRTLLAEKDEPAANASDDLFNGEKVVKSGADWKKSLTAEQFYVLREKGTERAFTGVLADNHEDGDYYCAACHLKLFKSDAKFESGTGWPSFFQPVSEQNVVRVIDTSDGETRTEVVCPRCGSHLGHVFSDGPKPTGLRYCMNSAALKFEKRSSNAGRQGS